MIKFLNSRFFKQSCIYIQFQLCIFPFTKVPLLHKKGFKLCRSQLMTQKIPVTFCFLSVNLHGKGLENKN